MITDYLRNALLNHALGVQQFTMPTAVWAGLYTVPPVSSAGAGGTEVNAPDYARVATSWNVASTGTITNQADIRFPATVQAANNWGSVVTVGLFDSAVTGNLLFFGPLSAAVSVVAGEDFRIAATQLSIGLG